MGQCGSHIGIEQNFEHTINCQTYSRDMNGKPL